MESMNQKVTNDHRLLTEITLHNLLSFGPDTPPLELQNLNILIGPNASGKSNLIEAISLMRATPNSPSSNSDFRAVIRRGGGVREWIWKGGKQTTASIATSWKYAGRLEHRIAFRDNQGFELDSETIRGYTLSSESSDGVKPKGKVLPKKLRKAGSPTIGNSILNELRDPVRYPQHSFLAESYEKIRIYRDWSFGRRVMIREPQSADMRNDRLEEDFSNLGLFLSRLSKTPKVKEAILEKLRDLYQGVTDFQIFVEGGSVQVFFTESDFTVPATRLSDGTLRYLCLLAILCDPTPPPLICIEEPELGLHPDIIPKLADLLVEAAERTQLIVTTHSDILIDAMSEHPEAVVVCEKHDGKTEMNRLNKKDLKEWLNKYSLGDLWTRGHIGGNRW